MIFDFHTHNAGPVSTEIADSIMRYADKFMTLGDVFACGKTIPALRFPRTSRKTAEGVKAYICFCLSTSSFFCV